jgi:ribosomal protein S18 acetylase RimI-like enzyme
MNLSLKYVDHLQKQNADDLAFYPLTTLEKAIEERRLLSCEDNGECAGYLWHGPARVGRDVVIYQACVDYESRRRYLGYGMVSELLELAKASGSLGVRLRTASSSESNEFWEGIGFYCTNVTQGGVKRGRKINHWRTDVQKPLFVVPPVMPSNVPIDLKRYQSLKWQGVEMPSGW